MKIIGLPRSSYYYARKHPKAATRPDVHEKVKEIFNRTSNGCGHRQIFMRLRREFNIVIAKKTVLKVMRELGLICKIRRQGFRKYSSYKGDNRTVPNLLARDFKTACPFTKIGTDVTEFALSFGKVYLAQVVDFYSNEILAFSISRSPNMDQQEEMFDALVKALPLGASPSFTAIWDGNIRILIGLNGPRSTTSREACLAGVTVWTMRQQSRHLAI